MLGDDTVVAVVNDPADAARLSGVDDGPDRRGAARRSATARSSRVASYRTRAEALEAAGLSE